MDVYLNIVNLFENNKSDVRMKNQTPKTMTVQEAGRLGGQATLQNQGVKNFKKIGKKGGKVTTQKYRTLLHVFGSKGGRPRRPSLQEYMREEDR